LISTIQNYYFNIELRDREKEREGRERERVPIREGEVEKVHQLIGRLPGFFRSSFW
jgi:hypothetical protein